MEDIRTREIYLIIGNGNSIEMLSPSPTHDEMVFYNELKKDMEKMVETARQEGREIVFEVPYD